MDGQNQQKPPGTDRQWFGGVLSQMQARSSNKEEWPSLIEEAEAMIQTYAADEEAAGDIGQELLAGLYFLAAKVIFSSDLAARALTHSKILDNEEKCLAYFKKAIALQDKEEYSYELWNFLATAGHREESIAALEGFIGRTGGTAKVLSQAAEYILLYADSEDTKAIQKSVTYFYQAAEKEPDRYETYWAFFTDLEEAVEVCPWLLKETVFCLEKLILLSQPEDSKNHDTLEDRCRELEKIYRKIREEKRFFEAAREGIARRSGNAGDASLAGAFFRIAHGYHTAGQRELAAKYYLAFDNGEAGDPEEFVPREYWEEYLQYHRQEKRCLIRCEDAGLGYDNRAMLEHLDFAIYEGDYVCIVGENGSGKSTLLKTILGLIKPVQGEIILSPDMQQGVIGYLPQQTQVQKQFPASVMEVVLSGFLNRKGKQLFYRREERKLAMKHMEKLQIGDLKNQCYGMLSGGQQQRVLLARALCAAREILVLDEPVTGLDPAASAAMYHSLQELHRDGMAIVMVTHDILSAVSQADKILHLNDGGFYYGTVEEYKKSEFFDIFAGR